MSEDIFTLSWFIVFLLVILVAFMANIIIIWAILRDKSMHTSTYFYIINVNIADILLVLSCLPERLAEVFGSANGYHLGMFTCYLIPFLQQVSMHAALAFLLILTVHRCYPAGVPRFLQGDFIRRQIRNYHQTLCILWAFAILINLPLFAITKYETEQGNDTMLFDNHTNWTHPSNELICFTGATEVWSRTYLILLLVSTYLITGIFLIVIYGQVIRIILASKRFAKTPVPSTSSNSDQYRYLSPNNINEDHYRSKGLLQVNESSSRQIPLPARSSSSSSVGGSNRRYRPKSPNLSPIPVVICTPAESNDGRRPLTNSHSTQHLQVIVMLFIVILLYILLLLPYRLLNLLYIVHNQMFQKAFMNEMFFQCLLNIVRLLVFLNCALQPITYLIISSRLRQTVIRLLRCWYQCYCRCRFSSSTGTGRRFKSNNRAVQGYLLQRHENFNHFQNSKKQTLYRDNRPLQTSLNNINLQSYQGVAINQLPISRTPSPLTNRARFTISFNNGLRK